LIASAPKLAADNAALLAALEALHAEVRAWFDTGYFLASYWNWGDMAEANKQARAAITKARNV
jgi:hypothetical protein